MLFSLSYYLTIGIVIIFTILGFILLKPKKGNFPTRNCYTYYFNIIIGGSVYLSCMIYQFLYLLGTPTLEIMSFFRIL